MIRRIELMRSYLLAAITVLAVLLVGCEEIFPEPEYTVTIVNESNYMLDVYLDGSRQSTVNSIPVLRAAGQEDLIQQLRLNTIDITGVSEGIHTLKILYKDCIDLSTMEQCETIEDIDVNTNLEITIE